ncbi:MAG: hypothetical protein K0T99_02540 [Alphaproteobacteria bacterium]|nr:hypothetical protein [Alphaproteobacteria bacterium]
MKEIPKEVLVDKYGNNKIRAILTSNLFWIGFAIKMVFAFTLASNFLTNLFIPFTNYYVQSGFSNPYKYFANADQVDFFPYPALMLYIMSIPRILFSLVANWDNISPATIFLSRLPILLADFLILIILFRLIKKHSQKILFYYWLSPILIYINYIHGQLDAIPISILFISLYFLFKRKFECSSLFLGLAIAAKTSIVIVLPFYFSYLLYSNTITNRQLLLNIIITVSSFFIINIPYIFSPEFIQMVLNNREQMKIFNLNYNFSDGNVLYFLPLAYLFLFFTAINLKVLSKDVYMMFLGFSFGIIALMISPMQGWYYWILPFFAYFHSKRSNARFDFASMLFLSLYCSYFIYFMLIKTSDYIQVLQIILPDFIETPNLYHYLQQKGLNADKISNLSFTLLQASLIANCIFIYKLGIKSYNAYKIFSNPFLLGICGDSGSGKTTISKSLESIFQSSNTTIIQGDAMHKWERGNEHWNNITHLNPKSNLLYDEISYLKAIKNRENISRRNYDHDTGKFTEEKQFKPSNLVIFEGLHSFYIKQMRDLYDLKIFINTSEDLRKNWKIKRDTNKRGYSKDKIIAQINNRKEDSEKFIKAQLKYADIIIELIPYKGLEKEHDVSKLLLRITASNSFYLEPLFNELTHIDSVQIKHEYEDKDRQFIEVNGNISAQKIDAIAYNLSLSIDLEDLGIDQPSWNENYIGIIQLFITYCVMKNLGLEKENK